MYWKTLGVAVLGLGLVVAAGCDTKKDTPKPDDKKKDEGHTHGAGPHKGTVFDLGGGKWHGEIDADHEKKEATVWILGADEKTPAPIKTEKLRLVVTNTNPQIEVFLLPTN